MSFYLASGTLPFTAAAGVVVALFLLEMASLLLGFSLGGDDGPDGVGQDVDGVSEGVDLDLTDGDGGGVLAWLGFGRVPLILVLIALFTAYALSGYALQGAASAALGRMLPLWAALPLALVPALPLTRLFSRLFVRLLPPVETAAVSERTFIGARAVITLGEASAALPSEARLTDAGGQSHYVLVRPRDAADSFPAGTEVVLIEKSGAEYRAIALPPTDRGAAPH